MIIADFVIFLISFLLAALVRKYLFRNFWGTPVSILAGMIALIGAQDILGIYTLSSHLTFYIEVLLCVLFACIPFSVGDFNKEIILKNVSLLKYNLYQHCFQWGSGLLLSSLVFTYFFDTSDFLGMILPAGFAGGHGSGAVIGSMYEGFGHGYMFSLAMMMATIGAFISVIGGILWIYSNRSLDFKEVEKKPLERPSFRVTTCFLLIAVLSYFTKMALNEVLFFQVPMLILGIIYGAIARFALRVKLPSSQSEDFASLTTAILVCIGIASIKILVIKEYIFPIVILSTWGVISSIILFKYVGSKKLGEHSFEKALFTWGWSIGGIVFGISLVDMIKNKSNAQNVIKFPLLYMVISPLEITLLLFVAPSLLRGGSAVAGIILLFAAGGLLYSIVRSGNDSSRRQ